MKVAVAWIMLVCCFVWAQEKERPDAESLIAARKKQIEEQNRLQAEAIEKARQEVTVNSESAKARFQLAEALSKGTINEDTFREIESEYVKAIELKPDLAEAYLGLARIRRLQSKRQGIEELIRKAIAVKSDCAEAYAALGGLCLAPILDEERGVDEQRQARLAADAFKRAVQMKPDLAEAYVGLGLSKYVLGQRREAVEALKEAVLYKPGDLMSRNLLGHVYIDLGDKDGAMEQYSALVELGKEFGLYLEATERSPELNLAMGFADDLFKAIKERFEKK